MALTTVSSERLSTNVKTSNLGTELKKKVGQSKNLIINGAFLIAERGTSSTTSGYGTVDRFKVTYSGTNENPTQAQVDVASGTTPYTSGFRKALKITNGNQTGGAGSNDYIRLSTNLEGQDIANSGWNYLSSSSFITLSFWVKSSVAQNFYGFIRNTDGTMYQYPFETGSLTADTWTKITKTIPGNSNLTFNNDNGGAWELYIHQFAGTGETSSGVTLNAWATYSGTAKMPDNTSTWYTTNDATFELTGMQLEVGSVATDFEHFTFADDLRRCQRYYYRHSEGSSKTIGTATIYQANNIFLIIKFPVTMRTTPTTDVADGTSFFRVYANGGNDGFDTFSGTWNAQPNACGLNAYSADGVSGMTAGHSSMILSDHADSYLAFTAEL